MKLLKLFSPSKTISKSSKMKPVTMRKKWNKIVSKNTPILATETLIQIFKDLDVHSLHSCTLVNRYWCQVAIPMLWVEPFENIYEETIPLSGGKIQKAISVPKSIKNLSFLIDTYINCLSEESKVKLTKAG